MKIFLAGSTGAIGLHFISRLRMERQSLIGIAHSESAADVLAEAGIESIIADALDATSVTDAIRRVRPDVIVNELTALPKHYTAASMREAANGTEPSDLKVTRTSYHPLSPSVCVAISQSSAFWYAPGAGLANETAAFAFDATPAIASGTRAYAELESSLAASDIL